MTIEKSIPEMFVNRARRFGMNTALKVKRNGRYQDISWYQFLSNVVHLSLGLGELGIRKDDKVCIISESRVEWVYADLAILSLGASSVPIFPTYSRRDVEYIVQHSEARAVIVSGKRQWEKISRLKEKNGSLLTVISIEPIEEVRDVVNFDALLSKTDDPSHHKLNAFFGKIRRINENDLATIIYTSGTTGPPKGVMLTHKNFLSNMDACKRAIHIKEGSVMLSVLPLSHVFERLAGYYWHLYAGVVIAFAENLTTILKNLHEVRPHASNFVPRIFEKIYHRIMGKVSASSAIKQRIFYWALDVGKKYYVMRLKRQRPSLILYMAFIIARVLVYNKIRKQFGGRLRFLISGGAKLSREIARFFYASGVLILEGYGLTETSPVISVNRLDNFRFGTVGIPLDNVSVRIESDGEIAVKGPSVMKGYYKDEELTKKIIRDEWLYTGDIGSIDEQGFLKITDRKKDIIVTSGGKNVAPQNIENILSSDQYINQIFVCGDGEKYLAALIVPDVEQIEQFAAHHELVYEDNTSLIQTREINQLMRGRIDMYNKDVAEHEKIKSFTLLSQEFTLEKGELTPTMKIKRPVVLYRYKEYINAMYRK